MFRTLLGGIGLVFRLITLEDQVHLSLNYLGTASIVNRKRYNPVSENHLVNMMI